MTRKQMFYDKGEAIARQLESLAATVRAEMSVTDDTPIGVAGEVVSAVTWGIANLGLHILVKRAARIMENGEQEEKLCQTKPTGMQ